ncbi:MULTISPECIES: hypothetical protein [unclassified Psychrobacter]|uniref:hypothetical protein n=1 Tax=unclassified Psychrobacter TaxID=196806 RepID=UPI00086A7A90|nr:MULTISPECIES: hypothetical protein [unclassified Psychrobacter]OEH66947.1 MAG: hypothetical protein BAX61_08150 [Psychrobacter sp. B29-1]PKG62059.1 hypothetical protein CXF56_13185 [Psychrobacter sp. Choline-02u-13]PKH55152.1 hypothetical protein CXF69_01415 [Psychrobacter sp. Choline-02u-9]TEW88072.1 hypothetical protein E2545_03280 [Psychrobacter sp. 230]|tara:strand:- start:52911 stop:53615 length:705 start_codon:yes stop_codon:yes gene_type:complete
MTKHNPYNFLPLQPTGRNETNTANTYAPEDMIKIYEQQFLIQVPEEELTEFLPALKAFYDIDNHTLDVSAIIFDAIADSAIIYNHKIKVGDYQILGELIEEAIEYDEDNKSDESTENEEIQAYTLECQRTFFINDVEIPYHFNLFIYGDGYSTLTKKETVLEKMYWFVRGRFEEDLLDDTEDNDSLESINAQLASLGVREMDLTTVDEIISYVEGSIIDDLMVDELNKLLDDAE